jgi:hypothetical protein
MSTYVVPRQCVESQCSVREIVLVGAFVQKICTFMYTARACVCVCVCVCVYVRKYVRTYAQRKTHRQTDRQTDTRTHMNKYLVHTNVRAHARTHAYTHAHKLDHYTCAYQWHEYADIATDIQMTGGMSRVLQGLVRKGSSQKQESVSASDVSTGDQAVGNTKMPDGQAVGDTKKLDGRSDMSFSISQIGFSAESATEQKGWLYSADDLMTRKKGTARLNPPRAFGFGHTTSSFHRYGYVMPPVSREGGGGHSGTREPHERALEPHKSMRKSFHDG